MTESWNRLQEGGGDSASGVQLSSGVITADQILVVGRCLNQSENVGCQATKDAREALSALQLRILRRGQTAGDIQSRTIEFIQIVEIARFEIILEVAVFDASIEGSHRRPEAGRHDPEAFSLSIARCHPLGIGGSRVEGVIVIDNHRQLTIDDESHGFVFHQPVTDVEASDAKGIAPHTLSVEGSAAGHVFVDFETTFRLCGQTA